MTQYIDKATVVAEINRVLNSYDPNQITSGRYALASLRDFLDTLEVKEVDLEKELKSWLVDDEYYEKYVEADIRETAKHFFNLGLQVNNPITAADRGMAEEIIINLKRVEKDYRIDLTEEMAWLRNVGHIIKNNEHE